MRDQRASGLKWAAAAAAVALVAGSLWFSPLALKNGPPPVQSTREVEPVAEVARNELTAKPLRVALDLREYATSGKEANGLSRPVALPRRGLHVTISFPFDYDPGPYEIQLLDSERRPRASASGLAAVRDGSTTLQTTLDLNSLPSGAYQLAVRRKSEDWHLHPAQVQ